MKLALLALLTAALILSTNAYAQNAPKRPSVGSKALVQVKPKAPAGCNPGGNGQGYKALGWRLHNARSA